ncbi:tRNA (guanosine(46)-N7)-methyltransferase TrmB [Haploplasma modicum]|uniref:tRNA (guanosine(46)-N7)-methyltransferase TrmB n=1 Tax=Haploplasma modicum TaxID=2150 RepID=UPI00214B606B|nr:tRNA (guanosine(46)-N7)-methyltransferase TrmB [Haploplasma modicum]MCR1808812.1 tRNA (guanosine(46)-N7)-methyltransferase TrmB [Haploplasma modicum]
MRQKKIKGLDKTKMQELEAITSPLKLKLEGTIHLEVGSGKGQFISSLANDNKDINYVALERNMDVCYRISQKKQEQQIKNLTVILDDSANILEYLEPNSVDLIYLNFSDPWPKDRHHKRRLTYYSFLELYLKLLKKDGVIQFRTDHESFFNDSITYISKYFDIFQKDFDYQSDKYYTEYEIKRIEKGNLYQLKARVKNV